MLSKMFDAFDHCPRQQHATTCNNMQQMIHKCCVLFGKKFGSFDRGLRLIQCKNMHFSPILALKAPKRRFPQLYTYS